ncbi:acyl-CoA dehydrogenase family protein [uncultured Nocardioides sp.]|uniref:acyl-CoA dehydrogenase family protein n=1 Tax=uncultured Nocardioides sp. TaxID=198441 RepID=UPI0026243159|nr:acyl-CoA dehydrogenase family protein [uncultured Nocardioides sp.]
MGAPVRLGATEDPTTADPVGLAELAGLAGAGVEGAVARADALGRTVPVPGRGATLRRWEALATLGAADLVVARALEPHLDALAILDEAGPSAGPTSTSRVPPDATWGVYAAEGPGARLEAHEGPDGWRLTGRKPWCSLAGTVSHALVTAWVDETRRGLFAVALRQPGVEVEDGTWSPAGLSEVVTTPVAFTDVATTPVGGPGWYLVRPGFGWGGIGVAAVWHGGAVGVARRVHAQAQRREPDQVALMHLGAIDAVLTASRLALADSAAAIDAGDADGEAGMLLAARVREVVATAAEDVLRRAAHTLGPGPLSQEPEHARRVADLSLYLRQHHAERDAAALGRLVADAEAPW